LQLVDPEAYNAVVALTQSVIAMARELKPLKKASFEELEKSEAKKSKKSKKSSKKGELKEESKIELSPEEPPKVDATLSKDAAEKRTPKGTSPARGGGHEVVGLPVGTDLDQKQKVQHSDGKVGWVSLKAGQIRSSADPNGHPVSVLRPGSR